MRRGKGKEGKGKRGEGDKGGTAERELKIDVKVGGKRETKKGREGDGKMEF